MSGKVDSVSPGYVLGLLEGTWRGEGKGEYPTIASVDYLETLEFERVSDKALFYLQRTKRYAQEPEGPLANSHWESGFIEASGENGLLE